MIQIRLDAAVREPGRQPGRHGPRRLGHQRNHRPAPERRVGLAIVGIGGVPGDPQQLRRHAERQGDLPRRRMFPGDEVHVRRRPGHGLPLQPAFQQQRPPGVHRTLVPVAQLRPQRLELFAGQPLAVLRAVDQRARRPRPVVQQRLVPGTRGVVHVDGGGRRLQRRKPVPVVHRIMQLQVQHRREPVRRPAQPHGPPRHGVVIGRRPSARPRNHFHPVRAQAVHLLQPLARRLQIGVAGRLQVRIKRLEQLGPPLLRIGPRQHARQRMIVPRPLAALKHGQRHRRRRLGDHPHAAIGHRVLAEPLAGQTLVVARRPHRPPLLRPGDHPAHGRVLHLRRPPFLQEF